jgi:hypothetical protein
MNQNQTLHIFNIIIPVREFLERNHLYIHKLALPLPTLHN